jgi:DNA-binding NarL/FixJ family response regulator
MARELTTCCAPSASLISRPTAGIGATFAAIGVGIVTQQALLADLLRLVLESAADLTLVGVAARGAEGVILAAHPAVAVLLLDLLLPDLSGIEVAHRLHVAGGGPAVVLLSDTCESWSAERLAALGAEAGVSKCDPGGYATLAATIRTVAATRPVRAGNSAAPTAERGQRLTHREQQVLRLIAQSQRNKEIAAALAVSVPTVESHLGNLYAKLGVTSRTAAVRRAQQDGLLPRR